MTPHNDICMRRTQIPARLDAQLQHKGLAEVQQEGEGAHRNPSSMLLRQSSNGSQLTLSYLLADAAGIPCGCDVWQGGGQGLIVYPLQRCWCGLQRA